MVALACLLPLFLGITLPPSQDTDFPAQRPVQAREYKTESTGFLFRIEPSRGFNSTMHCSLKQNGRLLWRREFPWTFNEAALAPNGTVVGYSNAQALLIVTIDANGKLLMQHRIAENSWSLHLAGFPRARGPILIQPLAGVAWLQVLTEACPPNSGALDPWKVIRLSDGEFLDDIVIDFPFTPSDLERFSFSDARVVAESGLTLLHWTTSDRRHQLVPYTVYGNAFSLVDLAGHTVWRMTVPDDRADPRGRDRSYDLDTVLLSREMILSTGPEPRFALWHVKNGERVRYEIKRDEHSSTRWRVVELGSSAYRGGRIWDEIPADLTLGGQSRVSLFERSPSLRDEVPHPHVTIDRGGRILVMDTSSGKLRIFDAAGTAAALTSGSSNGLPSEDSMRELYALELTPGGLPLDCVTNRELLPDGRRVVLKTRLGPISYPVLYLLQPGGKVGSNALLPDGPEYDWMSTSNRWIAVGCNGSKCALVRLDGLKVYVCELGVGDLRQWCVGQTPDGHTLMLVNKKTLELVCYELP